MPENTGSEKYVGFNSFNCVDVYVDEPGDNTVRSCDPKMLAHAIAERAKIQAALAAREAAARAKKAD